MEAVALTLWRLAHPTKARLPTLDTEVGTSIAIRSGQRAKACVAMESTEEAMSIVLRPGHS